MTIGDLRLGNSRSKIKDDVSVLEKVTCNLFLGRNVMGYLNSRLLGVGPARHVSSLTDVTAGVDTLAGLAGIGHTILKYK